MIEFFTRIIYIVKGWFTPEQKDLVPTKLSDPLDLELELECKYCDYEENISVHESDYISWHNGEFIQDAFPYLTAGQRELMISNTCDDCWNRFFPDDD
tara:strand:+ start:138 stop:431 length:294 start_codon:yes stop_codon:yes gene_type:complete